MNTDQVISEKNQIITSIKKHVPLFSKFFDMNISVTEYSKNIYNFKTSAIHKKRQQIVIKVISKKLQDLFGKDWKKDLYIDLSKNLAFNIVDHHQILNHPLLIGSNIIGNIDKFFKQSKQEAIIVISSGDVPPNNYFSKNGFNFHGKQIPLFSANERESSSYFIPKRDFHFIDRLKISKRIKEFNEEEVNFLNQLQKQFETFNFSSSKDYNDQITIINKALWPLFFSKANRDTLPELIYLSQEEITSSCLIEILKQENFISHTLFNTDFRTKVLNTFRGIVVAWREKENKGTHFFWRKHPNRPQGLRMFIKNGILEPSDERYKHLSVKLNPQTIIELLEKQEIYPSLFLIFSVLNFYMGIKPLTGYGSVVYLEHFRQSWLKCLNNSAYSTEISLVKNVEINSFIGGVPIFFEKKNKEILTLYAADIFEKGGMTKDYYEKIFKMKFNDLLSIAVADLYGYFSQKYVPENEKLRPKINFNDLATIILKDL